MRQFVIDELNPAEMERVEAFVGRCCEKAAIGRIYWLDIPDDLHSAVQSQHRETCAPFSAAIEFTERAVVFEMLVRSRERLRCRCIGYATEAQRNFILNFVDTVIRNCEISA